MSNNPLMKYPRSPGVHVTLPTGGRFLPEGELRTAISGELAILPMTAVDELLLKNPDSLLNGSAFEQLIKSCVPGITEPRHISIPDLDVLMLAIKLASYGDDLDTKANCPKCKTKVEASFSIRSILERVAPVTGTGEVRINEDLVAYVKPHDFESKTKLDMAAFEEQQLMRYILGMEDLDDKERGKRFNESFIKMAGLNLELLANCIIKITTPDGDVTNQEFIRDYIRSADKNVVNKIRDAVTDFAKDGIDRKIELTCPSDECKHSWTTDMVFDPAHFFA